MDKRTNGIEILAPAGSFESAISAINCGADAIYIGAKDFNARKNADNFTAQEFKNIVSHAHECGVKVYQTLNTVIYDEEIAQLKEALRLSCEAGVDALIVQDFAVYELVKQCCPNMPLHASTQMSVHTLKGAEILKDMGFERVVLSREMTEKEIQNITENCDVQTEVFVHGALCMCVSGQCYLSAMIGQRSGNRGLCAQPCRLPFSSNGEKGRYDLSLKDLSMIGEISKLKEMGVTSLKIEGRMKRPEYVAAAVTACRQAVDFGYIQEDISLKLSSVFSRSGFTNGYFENKLGSKMFGTRSHDDVLAADSKTLKSLENLYKKPLKRVGLDFDFKLSGNGSAVLKVSDGIFSAEVFADIAFKGEKLSLDKESAKKNLCKTGDTPYYLRSLEFSNSDSMMLPLSTVNALRREVIDIISKKRRELKPIEFNDNFEFEKVKSEIKKPDIFIRVNDISQLPKDKLNKVNAVLLPLEKITEKDVEFLGGKLVAQLPRVKFFSEEKVLQKLKQVRLLGVKRAVISNIGDILLCKEANVEAIGGFGLNVTNSLSVKKYAQLGLSAVTLSPELTITKMREISPHTNVGIIAYGNLPLMVTRNCPAKNTVSCEKCKSGNRVLVDRKNVKFPVMCGLGYSEILNSTPIYLADKTNELLFNDFMILYFTTESEKEVSEIIDEYTYKHTKRENITRGLYYRGSF